MRFALVAAFFVALVAAVPERMMESDKVKRQECVCNESSCTGPECCYNGSC
ncbi:hypothetical protein V8F20_005306 [Naviculisporaceae sp. PSN 640]